MSDSSHFADFMKIIQFIVMWREERRPLWWSLRLLKHHVLRWEALCFLFSSRRTAAAAVGDLWPRLRQLWTELRRHIGNSCRLRPRPLRDLIWVRREGGAQKAQQPGSKQPISSWKSVRGHQAALWLAELSPAGHRRYCSWILWFKDPCLKSPTLCFYIFICVNKNFTQLLLFTQLVIITQLAVS